MKRPAVFFDRDNTLIVSDGYLGDPSQVQLIEGAAEAVAQAQELGFKVVVISNQSGVARGMFEEEDVNRVNDRLDELLKARNARAVIDRHEYRPYHPSGTITRYRQESERRKPRPGMIHDAARIMALDLENSWMIGDAGRDVEAGHAAGCRTILFHHPRLKKSPAAEDRPAVGADHTASSLIEAVEYIASHRDRPAVDENPPAPGAAPPASLTAQEPDTKVPAESRMTERPAGMVAGNGQRATALLAVAESPPPGGSKSPEAEPDSILNRVAGGVLVRERMPEQDEGQAGGRSEESSPESAAKPPAAQVPDESSRRAYRKPGVSAAEIVAAHARGTGIPRPPAAAMAVIPPTPATPTNAAKTSDHANNAALDPQPEVPNALPAAATTPPSGPSGVPTGRSASSPASTAAASFTPPVPSPTSTRPPEGRPPASGASRVEHLLAEILNEIRRGNEQGVTDFSVSKLMAGITQAIVLFVLFFSYLRRESSALTPLLMLGLILQTFTIALLIMSRQK